MSDLTRWVGAQGRAFERVQQAFRSVGYEAPRPDARDDGQGTDGAYVANIVAQYVPFLTQREVLAVVRYGLDNPLSVLSTPTYTLAQIVDSYGDEA